ncbi:uncharacterized protein LOC108202210 [Daucus carota subsp. sativus]|uniref:uncharacterized protein LOC108202210 n=1 Tax=Daucus carota subsp. sativus TaxID=79200 RepID=UPI0007EF1F22|nr:PREDICTED: uncharacterized protein LOC108202210 isoform X1 [Daucus carota subsp. sativus]
MEVRMREMEKKKLGFQTAIFSFLQRWKHLEALLDLSPNTPKTKMLSTEKCKNPMREKLKGIDLNYEPCDDFAEAVGIEGKKLEEMMEIIESFDNEKLKNIDEEIKAIKFSKIFLGERAAELELREKQIDAKALKIEEKNRELSSRKKRIAAYSHESNREIAEQLRKVHFTRKDNEEYARQLESQRKELDDGFRALEGKKMEVAIARDIYAAKLLEIKEQELRLKERSEKLESSEKEVKVIRAACEKRLKVIESKESEIDSDKKQIEEFLKEFTPKQKELDDGFKELERKEMELAKKTEKYAGGYISDAGPSKNQTKRPRTSSDSTTLGHIAPARAELPPPQGNQTELIQYSDSGETFWTRCQSCQVRFRHPKRLINAELTCRACSKKFRAYELDAEFVPPEYYTFPLEVLKFLDKTSGRFAACRYQLRSGSQQQ